MASLYQRLPDRWVLGIFGFFGVIFAANGVLVYLAITTAPEIEQSYDQRIGEYPLVGTAESR